MQSEDLEPFEGILVRRPWLPSRVPYAGILLAEDAHLALPGRREDRVFTEPFTVVDHMLCPITVAAPIDKSQEGDFMRRRANHSYPRAMRRWHNPPVVVEPIEWVSLEDAARQLNKTKVGIGFLVGAGILVPTESSKGGKGITRSSLSDEVAWRSSASFGAWLKRLLRYIFYSLS